MPGSSPQNSSQNSNVENDTTAADNTSAAERKTKKKRRGVESVYQRRARNARAALVSTDSTHEGRVLSSSNRSSNAGNFRRDTAVSSSTISSASTTNRDTSFATTEIPPGPTSDYVKFSTLQSAPVCKCQHSLWFSIADTLPVWLTFRIFCSGRLGQCQEELQAELYASLVRAVHRHE